MCLSYFFSPQRHKVHEDSFYNHKEKLGAFILKNFVCLRAFVVPFFYFAFATSTQAGSLSI